MRFTSQVDFRKGANTTTTAAALQIATTTPKKNTTKTQINLNICPETMKTIKNANMRISVTNRIFARPRGLLRNRPKIAVHFSEWEAHFHVLNMQHTQLLFSLYEDLQLLPFITKRETSKKTLVFKPQIDVSKG